MPLDPSVRTVRVVFSDLHGVPRGKDLPRAAFAQADREGLAFCAAVMTTDLRDTPVAGGADGYPDLRVVPDRDTLLPLPWEPGVASCLADVHALDGGPPVPDPRGAVRAAVAELADLGLTARVAPELELFLLAPDRSRRDGLRPHVDVPSLVYTVGPQSDPGGLVRGLLEQLDGLGLGVTGAHHEFEHGQYEINLAPGDPLGAADRAFRVRSAVKDVAAQHGLVATFMGRPRNDGGGSGLHLHVSLHSTADGDADAAFADPGDPDGVSAALRWFVGGVLHHAPAATALLNPTVNSYARLAMGGLAPSRIGWGWDDRTALVRIPPERGERTRVEVRSADAAANPYLAVAAVLRAGAHGIAERIAPPAPGLAGAPVPRTLDAALDALAADAVLRAGLGPALVDAFTAVKRFEAERHRRWVGDWERDEYLRLL